MNYFVQKTGQWFDHDLKLIGTGYAGRGKGLNNPDMQGVRGVGPLCCGFYTIGPLEPSHDHLGLNVAELDPDLTNVMHGRSGFYLHGRKSPEDMNASEGCVVLDHEPRMKILNGEDRRLQVVAEESDLPVKEVVT